MTDRYILNDDDEPEPCEDLIKWARWMEQRERVVLQTRVGAAWVSTVFLGVSYNFLDVGPPILWETMIFGGSFDRFQWRSLSKLDAMRRHMRALAVVELAEAAPRKLKKAIRKGAANSFWNLRPRERARVHRALMRVTHRMEAA